MREWVEYRDYVTCDPSSFGESTFGAEERRGDLDGSEMSKDERKR